MLVLPIFDITYWFFYSGGAIAAFDEATVTLTNSDLSNNQAALGGAMAGQYKSIINLQATQIYKNTGEIVYFRSLLTCLTCCILFLQWMRTEEPSICWWTR